MCHLHGTPLRYTTATVDFHLSNTQDLITAQSVTIGAKVSRYVVRRKWRHLAQMIAEDTAWLLANVGPSLMRSELSSFYRRVMYEAGMVRKNGEINARRTIREFFTFCPRRLAELLDPKRSGYWARDEWPVQLAKSSATTNPVRHLLLIRFLGLSPESFFARMNTFQPFANGPWPCLNPFCKHYKKSSIKTVRNDKEWKDSGIIGYFHCACGFAYSRMAPDLTGSDMFKFDRIEHYGKVWESEFKPLWCNTDIGIRELVSRLGVPPTDIKRQAKALELPRRLDFDEEVLWPRKAAEPVPGWQRRLMEKAADKINVPHLVHRVADHKA